MSNSISESSNENMIAPCGVNCSLCLGYLREKNKCVGCRVELGFKPKHCFICSIKNCEFLAETESNFCIDCRKFPCTRLKQLNKRYEAKYHTSLFGNLRFIKEQGLEAFVKFDKERWQCEQCSGVVCIHTAVCTQCGKTHVSFEM